MKKVLALMLACVMVFTFVGCGGGSEVGNANADKVAKYIEASKSTPQYKQAIEQAEIGGSKLDIFAEGDDVVYEYTFAIELSDEQVDALKGQASALEASWGTVADGIRAEESAVDKVICRYLDNTGKILIELKD